MLRLKPKTGAKAIYIYGAALTAAHNWVAGSTVTFVYNGSQWVMTDTSANKAIANWCYNNNLTYINGGAIYAKSVTAAQIDVEDLFAQTITTVDLKSKNLFVGYNGGGGKTFSGLKVTEDGTEIFTGTNNPAGDKIETGTLADILVKPGEISISAQSIELSAVFGGINVTGPTDSGHAMHVSGYDTQIVCQNAIDESYSIGVGVGSGGKNRGIYDYKGGRWMIYADSANDVRLCGYNVSSVSASGPFCKCGRVVTVNAWGSAANAVIFTLASDWRPAHGYAVASGWCLNTENNTYYSCVITWNGNGTPNAYAISTLGSANNNYTIYNSTIDRRNIFSLFVTGSWLI